MPCCAAIATACVFSETLPSFAKWMSTSASLTTAVGDVFIQLFPSVVQVAFPSQKHVEHCLYADVQHIRRLSQRKPAFPVQFDHKQLLHGIIIGFLDIFNHSVRYIDGYSHNDHLPYSWTSSKS